MQYGRQDGEWTTIEDDSIWSEVLTMVKQFILETLKLMVSTLVLLTLLVVMTFVGTDALTLNANGNNNTSVGSNSLS